VFQLLHHVIFKEVCMKTTSETLVQKAGWDSEEHGEPNPTFLRPSDSTIPVFVGDTEKTNGKY
jgi:hypothetical protein